MDHNRAAATAWRRHIRTIEGWLDELNAALGDPAETTSRAAIATERALFGADADADWVVAACQGGSRSYWLGTAAHELRLGRTRLGAGRHAVSFLDRNSPSTYFRRHLRALESSIELLDRHFAGPEDARVFHTGMRRLRRHYVRVRDDLLGCALPRWAAAVRLEHQAHEARLRWSALLQQLDDLPSDAPRDVRAGLAAARDAARREENALHDAAAAEREAHATCLDKVSRAVTPTTDPFGVWAPPATDRRGAIDATGQMRVLVGDDGRSLIEVAGGPDGLRILGELITTSPTFGTLRSRVHAEGAGGVRQVDVDAIAPLMAVPALRGLPRAEGWPVLVEPEGVTLADGDQRNRLLQPLIYFARVEVGLERTLIVRGAFPEGDVVVGLDGEALVPFERSPDRLAVKVPETIEGRVELFVIVDGIRSARKRVQTWTRDRAAAPLPDRVTADLVETGLDIAEAIEPVDGLIGFVARVAPGEGAIRVPLVQIETDDPNGLYGMVFVDARFSKRFKRFEVRIKAAMAPLALARAFLDPDSSAHRRLSSADYDVVHFRRDDDLFEVLFLRTDELPGKLGIRYDQDTKRLSVPFLADLDLEKELGLRIEGDLDQDGVRITKQFVNETHDGDQRLSELVLEAAATRFAARVTQHNRVVMGERTVETELSVGYDEDAGGFSGKLVLGGQVQQFGGLNADLGYRFAAELRPDEEDGGFDPSFTGTLSLVRKQYDPATGRYLPTPDRIQLDAAVTSDDVYTLGMGLFTGSPTGRRRASAGVSFAWDREKETFSPRVRVDGHLDGLTDFDIDLTATAEAGLVFGEGNRLTGFDVRARFEMEPDDLLPFDFELGFESKLTMSRDVGGVSVLDLELRNDFAIDMPIGKVTLSGIAVIDVDAREEPDFRAMLAIEPKGLIKLAGKVIDIPEKVDLYPEPRVSD